MYKPPLSERKNLLKRAAKAHNRAKNIIAKSTYLNYVDQKAITDLAKHFYSKRFGDEKYFVLQLSNDVTLVKNLVQDPDFTDERLVRHFCKWIRGTPIWEQQSNLLDVLLSNYPNDRRVKDIHEGMKYDSQLDKGLYANKQNVHDEEVSAAALIAAQNLMMWYQKHPVSQQVIDSYKGDWGAWLKDHLSKTGKFGTTEGKKTIDLVVTRCIVDHSSFGNIVTPFTILDFLVAVLKFIFDMDDPSGTYQTIYEEFKDMRELCASGYIERGVTILQGLEGAENFNIVISEHKRLFAVISAKMADSMKKAPENVLLGTCDEEHQPAYLSYIEEKVNQILPQLSHFGEALDDHLTKVLDQYSSVPGWKYQDGKMIKPV
jgi:hypothetical protein